MKPDTIPDRWVVVKLTNNKEEPFEKVLAGWYGGYLGNDEWRFSSMIQTVEDKGDYYIFHNYSGSTYVCSKGCYGMSMLMMDNFDHYQQAVEAIGGKLELVPSYDPHKGVDHGDQEEGSSEEDIEENDQAQDGKGHSIPL